jgi:hypothetical protein
MNEEEAQAFVDNFSSLVTEIVGREMAKNGVIGKYAETYTPTINKLQKRIVKSLIK